MEFDQNTQKDTNTEAEQKANQYSNLIAELRGIGEYLMIAVPSSIDNQEMKRLEAKLSSLRNILNNELRKGRKDETGEISALLGKIKRILPKLSAWSDFANKLPNNPRPEELFAKLMEIGEELANIPDID